MLALSLILIIFTVITMNQLPFSAKRRPSFNYINLPLAFSSEKDGVLSSCVSLYYWFIVACRLGLFYSLSPRWRQRKNKSVTLPHFEPHMKKPRKPPDKSRRGFLDLFLFYLLLVFTNTNAVWHEDMSLASLSALPLTFILNYAVSSLSSAITHRENQRAIADFFAPIIPINSVAPSTTDSFGKATNADKLCMLCAWQTANSKTPVYMDYAPGSKAICIDTGASACISNDREDFISLDTVECQKLKGIGEGLEIAGQGTLRWSINDNNGNAIILHVRDALYVPKVPMCLLCPQQVAQQTNKINDGFAAEAKHGTLTYDGFIRTIPYNSRNGLPIVFTSSRMSAMYSPFTTELSSPNATCKSSYAAALLSSAATLHGTIENLTRTQRLLLLVHESMAHWIMCNAWHATVILVNPCDA
jgi:hypothetical protein